jgi:hypothetical protein
MDVTRVIIWKWVDFTKWGTGCIPEANLNGSQSSLVTSCRFVMSIFA